MADRSPSASPASDRSPEATEASGSAWREVVVPLGARAYPIIVGSGAVSQLERVLPADSTRVAIVTQPGIPRAVVDREHITVEIGVGEGHKTVATMEQLCRAFAEFGLTRRDVVVGVGGGMVTDLAGFAAASYHRGIPVVHVATSLLAMVDAAIGGKTGVNLPEGKNLVGAFWQPNGVISDLDFLATLPDRELKCGYGEMAKYHFLTGDDLLSMPMVDRVARCAQIKAEIVAADEREGGTRALLNYGHTLAHALEIATDHSLAHGEAVAIGLVYAAHLSQLTGRIGRARVDEHYRIVGDAYRLRTGLPDGVDVDRLVDLMSRDKKAIDGFTFVLDSDQGVTLVHDIAETDVRAALSQMRR